MRLFHGVSLTLACFLLPSLAHTQVVQLPQVKNAGGASVPSSAAVLVDSTGAAHSSSNPLPVTAVAPTYTVQNITSLSAGQAAGTAPILAANTNRRGLIIVPPADCRLKITNDGSTATGYPLYANAPNEIYLPGVPANALYIVGLSAGVTITIWEG